MTFTPNPMRGPLVAGVAVLIAAAAVQPLSAQVGAGVARTARLEVTTTSAEARTAFMSGMEDLANGFPNRATTRLKQAVDLDPAFGLARVIHGITAAGLTAEQRNQEIARGMTDVAKATPAEQLVAMAHRERFGNNTTAARSILQSAATILPDEPWIAYQRALWLPNLPNGVATDVIPALRAVIERFPDYAPSYNTLAYAQWEAGARNMAIQTAATYMVKATGHPKAHDTYAEIQQWNGNYGEAAVHYAKATEIDPTFLGGAFGLAEVQVLQGKADLARQTLTAALPHTTTPNQRINIFNRIASSFVFEGNLKAAMTALGTVIQEAQKAEVTGAVAAAHVGLMNLEAAFGDPKAVAAHVGHIAALPPPPTTANPAGRFLNYGIAFAIAGQTAAARVYLDSLTRRAQTNPTPVIASQVHGLTGWVLFSEGKFAEALAEFRQDNQQIPNVRAGIALSQFKLGNVAEARSIRDELATDRNLNLANSSNVFARRLVKQRIT